MWEFDFGLDEEPPRRGRMSKKSDAVNYDEMYAHMSGFGVSDDGATMDDIYGNVLGDVLNVGGGDVQQTHGAPFLQKKGTSRFGGNVININIGNAGQKKQAEKPYDEFGWGGLMGPAFNEGDKALRVKSGWEARGARKPTQPQQIIIKTSGSGGSKMGMKKTKEKKPSFGDKATMAASSAVGKGYDAAKSQGKTFGKTFGAKIIKGFKSLRRERGRPVTFADALDEDR